MKKETIIILCIVAAVLIIVWAGWFFSQPAASREINNNQNQSTSEMNSGNLQITDTTVGTGTVAQAGDTVTVNYVGTLDNGTKFDSSYDRHQPFSFTLGAGQVIQGWDQGVAGMRVGGTRELVIPSDLGYGAAGAGGVIPPNATLHFTVTLLSVSSGTQQ